MNDKYFPDYEDIKERLENLVSHAEVRVKQGKTLKLIRDKRAYTLDHVANEIGIFTD